MTNLEMSHDFGVIHKAGEGEDVLIDQSAMVLKLGQSLDEVFAVTVGFCHFCPPWTDAPSLLGWVYYDPSNLDMQALISK